MGKRLTQQEIHQRVFDRAVTGVLKQGGPSMIGSTCAYRGAHKHKCALGHLIKDSEYDPKFDGGRLKTYEVVGRLPAPNYLHRCEISFLQSLQCVHDTAANAIMKIDNYQGPPRDFVSTFKRLALQCAYQWNLDPKVAQ